MRENGINVRTYQDGKPFKFEVSTVYSKSLEFVAAIVDKDMNVKHNESKHIEVRHGDNILLEGEFKYMDIITDATNESIVYDLIIFHNGNIKFVLDYLKVNEFDDINFKLNKLLCESYENRQSKLIAKKPSELHLTDQEKHLRICLNKIPNWIRYLFNAL